MRDGDHFYEQATNQPRLEIFPESEKDFFLRVVNAQVTFVTDGDGPRDGAYLASGWPRSTCKAERVTVRSPKVHRHLMLPSGEPSMGFR